MKIKIVSTPPGTFAPEEIRKLWVGLVVESLGRENPQREGARLGKENLGGYRISGPTIMAALKIHNQNAYKWWAEHLPGLLTGMELVFKAEVCQEID